jgi:4-diphosphocytidyl-2C-methyl-D-erythritol kinase
MGTKEIFKEKLNQKQSELSKKIIKGTEQTDENGEFIYSFNDLENLCRLNQLDEIIKD